MQKQVRRVVTGHNAAGRAIVISDGPAPFVHLNPRDPDFFSVDVWRTFETPANIVAQPGEPTLGPRRQRPTPGGSVLRINHFPPESETIARMTPQESTQLFTELGNAHGVSAGSRHPLMHRTETIDYAIVLSGEITMLLDDEDVHLKAGDIVVQCGTNHAWSNRSKEPCLIAFILIDGRFDPDLKNQLEGAREA
ncbi:MULTISPECIES: cupin domain-containing protein [Chelativorans]|jgi:mannose-6-phosphate isomerase-like protein (cupin superfamily)|uniref:Cupin 2, conserved barrel n=1 Tax=Chelativorans sp. (strain BNC1) TaxID=266779 RepID=Q11CG7_CHESB|nr:MULTISPECIES: cupin domain-containing protein [Chelativorans]